MSTPITWAEVESCRDPDDLVFTADDVLDRAEEHGDLFEPLLVKKRPHLRENRNSEARRRFMTKCDNPISIKIDIAHETVAA